MNRIINKIADRKFWSPYLTSAVVILIALFLTRCFDIISFEQPETAIAGETISIKLDIEVLEDNFNPGNVGGTMPVVGFLAPKSWNAGANTQNILARIKGTDNGKALLLLTHYDSQPHSSLGASDAGSGVVTILEGLRAYLVNNNQIKTIKTIDMGRPIFIH